MPPHTNGVGAAFQYRATDPNRAMISPGLAGCSPSSARRFSTRWMLSAMFRHDLPSGVYRGITPWANSHSANASDVYPAPRRTPRR